MFSKKKEILSAAFFYYFLSVFVVASGSCKYTWETAWLKWNSFQKVSLQ